METINAKLTEKLIQEADDIVKEGWYANKSELIRDAVRELIRKIKAQRLETSIKEDIIWGLHGK